MTVLWLRLYGAELRAAPAAAERPGLTVMALALAAILADPQHVATQPLRRPGSWWRPWGCCQSGRSGARSWPPEFLYAPSTSVRV
jgi:hypothetical protein